MTSFENLTGQTLGSLRVLQIERRVPSVAWQARCITCGSSGTYTHQQLTTNPVCKNAGCGRIVAKPSPSMGRTTTISTGIRASDSASAREYNAAMTNADPATLARFIDYVKGEKS
jgi:hypothetical protein